MSTQSVFATSAFTLSLLLMLTGCATTPSFDKVYTRVSQVTLQPGDPLPQASTSSILTITGKIQVSQAEDADTKGTLAQPLQKTITMDESALEAVGIVEYAVEDPFEEESNIFQGVLFRDLLELWQVNPEATQLTLTALNDYEVQVPIALLQDYPIMLALQQNGQPMMRDYRGPTMLVAPLTQYPNVRELADQQYWIWQITEIRVE